MGRSIQEMTNKIKTLFEDDTFFYTVIIILVGVASFGLGKHSGGVQPQVQAQAVTVSQPAPVSETTTVPASTQKNYVASKNGSKYHLLTCPGASQIKEENKVFFDTVEQAHAQGYTPAGNCPGLK